MADVLRSLGLFAARRHRLILIAAAMLFAVATVAGIGAFQKLQSGGQVDPSAPSSQAEALVAAHFDGEQGLVILVTARAGLVSSSTSPPWESGSRPPCRATRRSLT